MKWTRKMIKHCTKQRGKGVDIKKWLSKTGIEFHVPGCQYLGPGTKLKKRLARGHPGINRLDRIAKQHDIVYARAKNLQDKWIADTRMIQSINKLPGKKTLTERLIRKIMKAKKTFEIVIYYLFLNKNVFIKFKISSSLSHTTTQLYVS